VVTRFACNSHTGLVRDHNEDNCLARPDLGLWVVADGMGGHLGGEIASGIVIDELARRVEQGEPLVSAVGATHTAVLDAVARGDGQQGMGSTVVALKLDGSRYEIAWVGDSRAYLCGKHGLRQISRDHSFVQQLLDAGAIGEEEAAAHQDRNVISQAIGMAGSNAIKVDVIDGQLHQGDQIMLCSDGLSGEVDDNQIAALLAAPGDEAQKIESLIAVALDHGGSDNVTVALVSAPDDAPPHPTRGSTVPIDAARLNQALVGKTTSHRRTLTMTVVVGAILITLVGGAWYAWEASPTVVLGDPPYPNGPVAPNRPNISDTNPSGKSIGEKHVETSVQK